MLNAKQVLAAALVSALSTQVEAAKPCPFGPASNTARQLKTYAPAQAYCSAIFPLDAITRTVNAPATTVTSTVATVTSTVNGGLITSTVTAPGVTITSNVPVSTVTVPDPLNTLTLTGTSTVTVTSFTATITTTTVTTLSRGVLAREAEPTPAAMLEDRQAPNQAALFNSLIRKPVTNQAKICTCLEGPRTTTNVFGASTPTVTIPATATSFVGGDFTNTITTTPTITTTIGASATTVTTVVTITNFDPVNTATQTVGAVQTAVATITIPANGPNCLATGDFLTTGIGGCTNNCYCDLRESDGSGFCNNGLLPTLQSSNYNCTSDADCAPGSTCTADPSVLNPAGTCLDFTGCFSTFDAATGTFPGKGPVGTPQTPTVPVALLRVQSAGRKSGKISK